MTRSEIEISLVEVSFLFFFPLCYFSIWSQSNLKTRIGHQHCKTESQEKHLVRFNAQERILRARTAESVGLVGPETALREFCSIQKALQLKKLYYQKLGQVPLMFFFLSSPATC